jgi:5-methylcytosine-specific restriction protein A
MPSKIPSHRPFGAPTPTQARRDYRSTPDRQERDAFYNAQAWRRFSKVVKRERPLCEPCLKRGETTPTEQIHHVLDWQTHPDLAYAEENMIACCRACHNAMRRNG